MIVFKHEFISMPLDVTFSLSFLTLLEIFHPFLTLLEIFIPLLTLHEIYLPNTPEPRYSKRARQTPFVYYIKSFTISRHSKKWKFYYIHLVYISANDTITYNYHFLKKSVMLDSFFSSTLSFKSEFLVKNLEFTPPPLL